MKTKGIDVSGYQGIIDWQKVIKAGVEFAILKVIRKDLQPDKRFKENWEGCAAAGLPVQGVYNYSYATTVDKAVSDAKRVVEVLNGRKPMVWLDIENECQKGIGKTLINIINAYGAIITAAGLEFGVYTGLAFYNSYIKPYADTVSCPFWIARYPSSAAMNINQKPASDKQPEIVHDLYGWQYSSKGYIPGIKGNVDLNELYVAVESVNVMPEPEQTLHKVGESIKVSSYYASSTAPINKAVIKSASGTIMRIKAGAANPYCFGKNGVAIGWCNDGDIRESIESSATQSVQVSTLKTYTVRRGDTLSAIGKKYGKAVADIVAANKVKYPKITANYIVIGWILIV